MFVMSYFIATKWGSMQERSRIVVARNLEAARRQADNFHSTLKRRGVPVYPRYDLVARAS
jgi:predicted HTH domain antitoxin